jgi:hypothetical protein
VLKELEIIKFIAVSMFLQTRKHLIIKGAGYTNKFCTKYTATDEYNPDSSSGKIMV